MNLRIRIIIILFGVSFLLVIARLFFWQVIKADELTARAKRQYGNNLEVKAGRGNILADDGTFLAGRADGWLAYVYLPDFRGEVKKAAKDLAPFFLQGVHSDEKDDENLLKEETVRVETLLTKKDVNWVALKSKLASETKKNLEALGINGLGFEPEDLRVYPEASTAAHLLGFVGKDKEGLDRGYFGLEGYYDLVLSGKSGSISRNIDALGAPVALEQSKEVDAFNGVDLVTNLNKGLQLQAEEKLKEGIEKYGAKGGSVVVMEPKTGAIKVMASYPTYDPASYFDYGDDFFKNPVISNSFEPGSVFKVVIMASALDAGAVTPETRCDICSGPLKVDKYLINTWNNQYHPDSTMTEVIVNSDNVGMSFVALKLGRDKLFDYLQKFGFGRLTGVDLQGEFTPSLREKKDWSEVDLVTASFGQGIAVTPIQLIKAVGAIANGGVMVKPQVVKKLQTAGWVKELPPVTEGRVISQKAAGEMTMMMVKAAQNGESKWIYQSGFGVAGKTGTAQVPISGHYDPEKTNASFIGFAPYNDPEFIMLVTLWEPQSSPWASETAAPLWYNIAKDLFIYYGIRPDN